MARGKKVKKSKGLGDSLSKLFTTFGIKECEPCSKRKDRLNNWKPYYNKEKGKMTKEQYEEWKEYKVPNKLTQKDMQFIVSMYNCIFHTRNKPCAGCSGTTYQAYIVRIDNVFSKYKKAVE